MIFVYAGCDEAESTEPYDTYKKIDAVYTSDDGNYNIAVVVWNHVSYEFLNVNIICIENKTNIFRELSSFTVLDPYSDYQTDLPRYKFDSYGSYAKLQVQTFGDDYEDMTIYWDEIMQYS
jgi:hypothetical protein